MSALGQKQTYALQQAMSALPPKADKFSGYSRIAAALGLAFNRNKPARNGWMPFYGPGQKNTAVQYM
jgi:hypothetical protein